MLNRRPYYRSVANWRLRNKPKPLAELTLFPSDLVRLTGDQCWRPGLEKVASVLQPCLCVRQVTGPSQRVTQRECCVLWNIFLNQMSYGKYTSSGALN